MGKGEITATKEDYIRVIYLLSLQNENHVRSVDVAKNLQLKKSTVSESLKKLSDQKLIKYERYSSITLTPEGKLLGSTLTYKHRVIEVFLHKTLGIPVTAVHREADKLEHAFSDQTIIKLASFLNFPKEDPHGNAIVLNTTGTKYEPKK
ncbi:hypothetical protein A3D77_06165 [Candidatus Gottesmanbacteria bacterium RIFCSPHIGHO2_02_FULL_39_11]|uniref:Manganese transport regulator n=1 Tax=Candidatus Gottesmanbacteria bacterium RIFCSPHIGHO2_02_FULL_39_11 TaxID=1798382 RepID=A0A1F5ZVQ9_9BACT|nr:MAG: hypothetical protein A3D77_06165 [Candidatus Gottesmanbacteria bacterium RIFCSPHIGHO2_02_FULL_39_11]